MTQRTTKPLAFSSVRHRELAAEFTAGHITSDAGLLLLREADKQIGLLDALDAAIPDPRRPEHVTHPQRTLLAQRLFGLAAGYEDLNDHDRLRHDPLWQAATDHPESDGSAELASPPTLCRLENRIGVPRSSASLRCSLNNSSLRSHRRPANSSSTSTPPTTRSTATR